MNYFEDDDYYRNAKKTPDKMREIIKVQSERLKELNKEVRELKAEQKRTYKEMIYFRNKSRRSTQELKELKEMMDNAL